MHVFSIFVTRYLAFHRGTLRKVYNSISRYKKETQHVNRIGINTSDGNQQGKLPQIQQQLLSEKRISLL